VIDILLADQRRLKTRVADLERKLAELEARGSGEP
jgi:hypothetical protein